MKTVYSTIHRCHADLKELHSIGFGAAFEKPERAENIIAAITEVNLGMIVEPIRQSIRDLYSVHDEAYVGFLSTVFAEWSKTYGTPQALPTTWPRRGLRNNVIPRSLDGRLGYYSFDVGAPIVEGTWSAALESAFSALTAADMITLGEQSVFALCRPPGHHAGRDFMGGYCYLNNAALAAQRLREKGADRVAVLDIDYHHGNGTQQIFYERSDVFVANIHADPDEEYPYFLGFADERGASSGEGSNLNIPLPLQTTIALYLQALSHAMALIKDFGAEALVVSLGVDTFENDPSAYFRITTEDYKVIGCTISSLRVPTVFVMEGGYAAKQIGQNVVNVLMGFLE